MTFVRTLRVFAAAAVLSLVAVAGARAWTNGFSSLPAGTCFMDGQVFGPWMSLYGGYGCTQIAPINGNYTLVERPYISTNPDETHASLVTGPKFTGDINYKVWVYTNKQLRISSAPNPWEVAWVVWNYTDDDHFYYFVPKPNGWELGKEDPAYPGSQRYLKTGTNYKFPIGKWYKVRIIQTNATIQVFVNDILITTYTDTQRPYKAGKIGMYNEDAEVYFDKVDTIP